MTGFNHKKIISILLITATLALFLPLNNIYAQTQRSSSDEFGDDEPTQTTQQPTTQPSGQTSSQPTAANESISAALRTAACPVIADGVLYYTACGLLTAGAWIVFVVLMAVSAFFALFGNLFDLVTAVTLNPATYSVPAIYNGWTIARDTANMFFIFILLTIAIATILQIETYGAKRLLPKLIAAAIFINFSFLLTQYVIFASNTMTGFFLPGAGTAKGPSSQLSVMFLSGINPNAMYKNTQFNLGAIAETQKKLDETRLRLSESLAFQDESSTDAEILAAQQEFERATAEETRLSQQLTNQQKELPNTLIQLIVAMLGVIAFILVATFALAFAGISLLIRVVVLWFLMILSPIAFLFFVIPGLSGHAQKWWGELLKQSFFAPAFFFLFGLTVQMISTPQARALFETAEKIAQQTGAGAVNTALIVSFTSFAYYTLLIIMLIASVLVAKQMGARGADGAIKYGKAAFGYARGAIARPMRAGLGRGFRELEKTQIGKTMAGIPGLRGALSRGVGIGQKDIKGYEGQYKELGLAALESMQAGPLLNSSQKEAVRRLIDDKKKVAEKKMRGKDLEGLRAAQNDTTISQTERDIATRLAREKGREEEEDTRETEERRVFDNRLAEIERPVRERETSEARMREIETKGAAATIQEGAELRTLRASLPSLIERSDRAAVQAGIIRGSARGGGAGRQAARLGRQIKELQRDVEETGMTAEKAARQATEAGETRQQT